jgi:hypothetical protein
MAPVPIPLKYYTVHGVKPDYSGEEEFLVETAYVDHLKASGQVDKWRASPAVSDVLKKPDSTFRGLKRPTDDPPFSEGLIYCGKPTDCYGEQGRTDPPRGYVLAVYVILDHELDSPRVIDWDWKEEDTDDLGHPRAWQADYGERIWPTSQKN